MNGFQKKIISKALCSSQFLTDYENEFITSLTKKSQGYELTENENRMLNKLCAKVYYVC